MSEARETVLARIRASLRDRAEDERPDTVAVPRAYRRRDERDLETLIHLLRERLIDYGAEATVLPEDELGSAVRAACGRAGLRRLATSVGVPPEWHGNIEVVVDDGLDARTLDGLDGALTGCALAIAETGTIVLDGGPDSGPRALTLIPDHHLCVVRTAQIVGSVPEAVAALHDRVAAAGAPITFVSGPSASSDIELDRVEGVHGPRNLRVFIVR